MDAGGKGRSLSAEGYRGVPASGFQSGGVSAESSCWGIASAGIFRDVNKEVQRILQKKIRAEGGAICFYEVFHAVIEKHADKLFQKIKGKYSDSDYAIGFSLIGPTSKDPAQVCLRLAFCDGKKSTRNIPMTHDNAEAFGKKSVLGWGVGEDLNTLQLSMIIEK